MREHPIDGRATLAFVDEQHCHWLPLLVVVASVGRGGLDTR
jgi:hypothetical protein